MIKLALLGTFAVCFASAAQAAPLDAHITVKVTGAPLATFLDTLSSQAKINFILKEGAENQKITADMHDVAAGEALTSILQSKGLSYHQLGKSGTYIITPKDAPVHQPQITEDSPALQTLVSVKVKNAGLASILAKVAKQSSLKIELAKGLEQKKITMYLSRVTVKDLFQVLVEIKDVHVRQMGKDSFIVE